MNFFRCRYKKISLICLDFMEKYYICSENHNKQTYEDICDIFLLLLLLLLL